MSQQERKKLQQDLADLEAQLANAEMVGDEDFVLESIRDEIERVRSVLAADRDSTRPKKRKVAGASAEDGDEDEEGEGEGRTGAAAAQSGGAKRRPVVRTMGTYQIQEEIASIQAMDKKELSKNRPRLQALNAELEKRTASMAAQSGGAGAGGGGKAPASSGRAMPKIHGKAVFIEITSGEDDDEEDVPPPPLKKPVGGSSTSSAAGVVEIDDDSSEEAAAAAVAQGAGGEAAAAGFEQGLTAAAAAARVALGEGVGDFNPPSPGEDPSVVNRRALEHLAELMRARARIEKVQSTLASAVDAVDAKIEEKRRAFEAEKDAAASTHETNPTRANQDKRDQFFFTELENENREMIPTKLATFKEEVKRLTDLAEEARMVLATVPAEVDRMNTRVQNFMVSKFVRRAFAADPAYSGLAQTEAIEKFKREFNVSSFGRRRVVGLLAFFGNYRRKHPRARARKIVGKYVRALTLFG